MWSDVDPREEDGAAVGPREHRQVLHRGEDAGGGARLGPEELVAIEGEDDGIALVGMRDQNGGAPVGEVDALDLEGTLRAGAEVIAKGGEVRQEEDVVFETRDRRAMRLAGAGRARARARTQARARSADAGAGAERGRGPGRGRHGRRRRGPRRGRDRGRRRGIGRRAGAPEGDGEQKGEGGDADARTSAASPEPQDESQPSAREVKGVEPDVEPEIGVQVSREGPEPDVARVVVRATSGRWPRATRREPRRVLCLGRPSRSSRSSRSPRRTPRRSSRGRTAPGAARSW